MRSYTHISHMVVAGLGSLVWLFAPIAQLVVFVTITPRFGMQGSWESVSAPPQFIDYEEVSQFTNISVSYGVPDWPLVSFWRRYC